MRALEQQSIVRLTYAGRERARGEERKKERHHCSNIPCLTQHRTYTRTRQDILITRNIPLYTHAY